MCLAIHIYTNICLNIHRLFFNIYICVNIFYTSMYLYTYIYIYTYTYVYKYIYNYMFSWNVKGSFFSCCESSIEWETGLMTMEQT